MEDKEITLEYIDSLIKSEQEALNKLTTVESRKDNENLDYLEKALNNEVLGKYIKHGDLYMKVTSIRQKRGLNDGIELCGLKICYSFDEYDTNNHMIITNGIILTNCSCIDEIEIVSEEEFQSEFNKIMDSVSKQVQFEKSNETNNEETIDKAKSLIEDTDNESRKLSNEINVIHNNINKAIYKYCKKHYLNRFVAFLNDNNKALMYMYVKYIDRIYCDRRVQLNGDSVIINYRVKDDSYKSIDASNYRSIKIISEEEFNKAYEIAIKRN